MKDLSIKEIKEKISNWVEIAYRQGRLDILEEQLKERKENKNE